MKNTAKFAMFVVFILVTSVLKFRIDKFNIKPAQAYVIGGDCQQITVIIPYGGDLGKPCNYLSSEFDGAECFATLQACDEATQESHTGKECLAVSGVCRAESANNSGCFPDEIKSSSNIANIGCPLQPGGADGVCCVKSGEPLNCGRFTTFGSCTYPCLWQLSENGVGECKDMPNWPTPIPTTSGQGGPIITQPPTNMCPNDATLPAVKYIKFTCPNGCTLTTESDGVKAWRCYENREESSSPLYLNDGECGQVDVLSGSSDNTYCGYTDYNCDDPCRGGGGGKPSPTPTKPVVTQTQSGPSCNNIAMVDLQGVELTNNADDNFVPGQTTVKFRCGSDIPALVDHYEFRITAPSGEEKTLTASSGTLSDGSYLIEESGMYSAQCRICISADQCHPYEGDGVVGDPPVEPAAP